MYRQLKIKTDLKNQKYKMCRAEQRAKVEPLQNNFTKL